MASPILFAIDLGNGLLSEGAKQSREPILTYYQTKCMGTNRQSENWILIAYFSFKKLCSFIVLEMPPWNCWPSYLGVNVLKQYVVHFIVKMQCITLNV